MSHTENEGGENPPGEPWDLYKYYFSYPSVPKYIIDAHYLHRHSYGITFKTVLNIIEYLCQSRRYPGFYRMHYQLVADTNDLSDDEDIY